MTVLYIFCILICGVSDVRPNQILTGQSVVPVFSAFKFDSLVGKLIINM